MTGVDASDLLINGLAATNVTEFASGQFVFSFPEPADGPVTVSWAPDHGITDRASQPNPFAGGTWSYRLDTQRPPPGLVISEFMAENTQTLKDEDGDRSDWIELFNSDDTSVNLEGWFLTDTATNLSKWKFPAVTLLPKEFLVIFASEKNRTDPLGRLHTNFKLAVDGEYLALVSPQTNVVSQFAPAYPVQRADVSYGRAAGDPTIVGYFARPTPGAPNSESGSGFAPEVVFSSASGSFVEPFALELRTPKASNSIIRYTVDGTLPTNSSPVYLQPIQITNSVQVRARSFQEELLPGPPRSEMFLMLSNALVSFSSDLPVLVIHTLSKGSPTAGRASFATISVFEPVEGETSLVNPPTLVTRSGVRVRGSSTQGLPKASFAVEFWDEYNQDKDESLLGLPSESDWVLYAPNSFEPVLIHNPFIHQLSRDIGRYSPRTRFVEVYLNKTGGPLTPANYSGIYVLEEKIKIGSHRVAIDRLQPEHAREPEVTGGYLLKIDRLDPGDSGFTGAGQRIAYVDPKEREIRTTQRDPQEQYLKNYFIGFGKALNGTDWLDPELGYAAYVDVDAWIDFHVLEVLSGNVDALVLSTYFHKPRQGKIAFGPHWDFDRALGSTDGRDANPRKWSTGPFFTGWWSRLFRDPAFWQKWIDRYQELRQSHLSQTNINRLIDELADEVRQAQPRERQRWHVTLRGGSYQTEVNLMKNWLSNRTQFIDKQLVGQPTLSAPGGNVTPGFAVALTAPPNATIFYTTDGSDPRLPQGGVAPQAITYLEPVVISNNTRIVARARNLVQRQTGGPPISSPWSGPVTATYTVHPPPLLITEIMFHPAPGGLAETNVSSDFAYVELKNVSAEHLSLVGYHFTNGLNFRFTTTSPITDLGPGERVLVVSNLAAFQRRYPGVTNVVGEFSGSLGSNTRLTVVGPVEEPILDLEFDRDWKPLAHGFGFSVVLDNENVAADRLNDPRLWRLSSRVGGSPGQVDPPAPPVPHVVVNELVPNPLPSMTDGLELFNPTAAEADISGWYITDEYRTPKKHRIGAGVVLPPGGYVSFKSLALDRGYLGFSKFGEQVYLFSADAAGELTGWVHGFEFGAADPGVSFGRYVTSTGEEAFVAQITPTLGTTNSGPRIGPVIISELKPSSSDTADAYIELWNTSAVPVPLFDSERPTNTWRVRGSADFDFPAKTVLGPDSFCVLVGFDPASEATLLAQFRSQYGFEGITNLFGPWHGRLDTGGGNVRLLKPGAAALDGTAPAEPVYVLVDQVRFTPQPPWPAEASAAGLALVRRGAALFGDDPGSWTAALANPGDRDSDGDGLPDLWELGQGLDPGSAVGDDGGLGDPDGDGFTNGEEFLAGSAVHDPASHLRVQAQLHESGHLGLEFKVSPGRTYTIEFRDTLTSGRWEPFRRGVSRSDSGAVSFMDLPTGTQRFYRVTAP